MAGRYTEFQRTTPYETHICLGCLDTLIDMLEKDVEYSPRTKSYVKGARQALMQLARMHTPRTIPSRRAVCLTKDGDMWMQDITEFQVYEGSHPFPEYIEFTRDNALRKPSRITFKRSEPNITSAGVLHVYVEQAADVKLKKESP